MELTNKSVLSILEAHGVECDVDEEGAVWAMDEFIKQGVDYSEWVEVTGWTRAEIMTWLGY